MFFKKKKKLMVIGIDGVPYELLKSLAEKDIMPNMKSILKKYELRKTSVPLPEISSVSWTSFMTGLNPGQHGIYGFMEMDHYAYSYIFPSFVNLPVKTVWEEIAGNGFKSLIINLPGTYPARPMNGALVSGFVAIDLAKAVYPSALLPLARNMNYQIDVDTALRQKDKKQLLKELHDTLAIRLEFLKKAQKVYPWDLCFFIVTGTDRLHHFFFDAAYDESAPYHRDFLDYYAYLDTVIGELTASMEKQGIPFLILSDHGFTTIKQEVYLSQYLQKWGYLHLAEGKEKGVPAITEKTRVFALDPSRVYIHLEGKYKRGRVSKAEYEGLREEIKERFMNLEIDGEKVIRNVFHKEEIYRGQYLEQAPDLVLLSNYGFDLKSGIMKSELYGRSVFTGMHTYDNALLIDSYGMGECADIVTAGQNVRHFFI